MEIAPAVICSLSELEALFPVSLYAPDVVTANDIGRDPGEADLQISRAHLDTALQWKPHIPSIVEELKPGHDRVVQPIKMSQIIDT
jgi:hypothetical protein